MWEGGKCENGEIEFGNDNLQMWVKILISKLLPCFVQQKRDRDRKSIIEIRNGGRIKYFRSATG